MSSKIELLLQLKIQLVNFLDELIDTFPQEADFVIFRIFVKDQIETETIMNFIIKTLCPLQHLVKERDEKFFLENDVMFSTLAKEKLGKVSHFRNIWTSGALDEQEKEAIWSWFSTFIAIGNKYKS